MYKAATKTTALLKELEKRVTAYQALIFDMKGIADRVHVERKFSTASHKLYESAQRRYGAVFRMPSDKMDDKFLQKCQRKVEREIPADSLFIPEE